MDFASLSVLLILGALGGFWFRSIHILDIAREAGRKACLRESVQFLDDTVAGAGIALARDKNGRRALRRSYRFEFTETGNSRLEGEVVMLGERVESVTMEPYRMLEDAHSVQDDVLNIQQDAVESRLPQHRSDHGG
jgi:hypothetical protein